jgi:hypothetical protein
MKIFKKITSLLGRKIALSRDRKESFAHYLAICAIFRDEAIYLEEWLNFHYKLGVSHFYLYNDRSEDDYLNVLKPWMDKGLVTLKDWHQLGQSSAYNDCIKMHRMEARWIAIIDLDEFLFSPIQKNLLTVLKDYEDCAAIFVYWILFGSSGHIKRPETGVLQSYTRCMDYQTALKDNFNPATKREVYVSGRAIEGKSIVNPRLVREFSSHSPSKFWSGFLVNENKTAFKKRIKLDRTANYSCTKLRINHYWSKSIEDLVSKVERGSVKIGKPKRNIDCWLERESMLNVAEDKTIQKIVDGIKFN